MKSKNLFRRHLAVTTILTVAPFFGYGRQAYAACDPAAPGSSTILCSGANAATVTIVNVDNANVSTAPGFSVDAAGDGVHINGFGHIQFTDTNASTIKGGTGAGIIAYSQGGAGGNPAAITISTNGDVTGGRNGIKAMNYGGGDISITADGKVTATNGDGIYAYNAGTDGKVTVTTGAGSEITGNNDGIDVRDFGGGDTEIIANGKVTGTLGDGIVAHNTPEGGNLTITTGAGSEVSGGDRGIEANNFGLGSDLSITVDGKVTGKDGVFAVNSQFSRNLTITVGADSEIEGTSRGIRAENNGTGDLLITVAGRVTGQSSTAVRAVNSGNSNNITIVTAVGSEIVAMMDEDYNGGNGISASNYGRGNLDITVNGDVTSERYHGIYAFNYYGSGDLKITVGAESTVRADYNGIDATNFGTGNLDIAVDGTVISEYGLAGVVALNWSTEGGDLTVATGAGSVISANHRGIMAKDYGAGSVNVFVNGEVTGRDSGSGIYTENFRGGETNIVIGTPGLVQGAYAGIEASSGSGQAIAITNFGTVRNISGAAGDLAIKTIDGRTTLANNGRIIGRVVFGTYDDVFSNNGSWTVGAGDDEDDITTFGDGDDTLNNRGILITASDAESDETTTIDGLEVFNNAGAISLSDGQSGDVLEVTGDVTFNGTGGKLVIDADLAEGGKADRLIINGTLGGVTKVSVKATGAIGANSEGITVAEVIGDSSGGDFTLDEGSRNMGLFAWDMRRNAEDGDLFELYSSGLGAGAYEFAGGLTAAQDVWFQSMGTLLQRQADLRATITGTQVTPVADFSEPVAPTAAGRAMPGFWFKALGAYLERDAEENGITLDRRQTIIGGLAGLDVGMDLEGPGETVLFGIFGGYLTSDLKFKSTSSKWDYEGPSIGAYATYLNQAFYADLTVKADFLSIDIDADDLAPGTGKADTKGFNLGGQIDAGYKIGLDHGLFVEPQASLALLHTEIDDIDDILGGAVEFDDETSVRGRLGARLGHEFTGGNALIYASDLTASVWQEFNGSNGATILAPDFAAAGVSDDTVGTFGDVSVGFAVTSPEGWSSFLRGSWQFAEDFDALSASAGLRYAW
ncbi:autotransporter outer membrane beta-barrel domain-containing protein [Aestuariivirga sp. YIM B02566]|uniref:Autotransporter outer membrane beta-barrel domain-containing protein n=1 Tax=Taklimakanibacter albus TaxID=2800327 RepID=A0ACC5RB96_9HYPH|nr:autotransporter outer membrane beta-barrel domain-containing protein [Aestuariivirga sp. YIM B02566]MBK1869919.1 autotransporter outer membrane beta-barrel domain-containing protein [Aestuariivirga sp. YIM B02566]